MTRINNLKVIFILCGFCSDPTLFIFKEHITICKDKNIDLVDEVNFFYDLK